MSCVDQTIEVKEGGFGTHTFQLTDEAGANVPLAAIDTAVLTLVDVRTGTIINSRNAQNVKNANQVTIGATGLVTWTMLAADSPIVTTALSTEKHEAHFRFTWTDTVVKTLSFLIEIRVCNIGAFVVS